MRACNNLPQDVGIELRKIVACSHSYSQCLLVSTVFGTMSSLGPTSYFIFNEFYYPGLALTVASGEMILPGTGTRTYALYMYTYTCIRACVLCALIKTEVVTSTRTRAIKINGVGLNGNRRDGPGFCFLKVRHYHTIQKPHLARK